MKVTPTRIRDAFVLEPRVFGDVRGFFLEIWNERDFRHAGIDAGFVQDNLSRSRRGVLRGLHYQIRQPQGKLLRVLAGEICDVIVDIRRSSPTFGRWVETRLRADEHRMLWIPPGLAHGFLVVSDSADVFYKATDYWAPEHERAIRWNDPVIGIDWPTESEPLLSAKDAAAPLMADAELYP